MTGWVVIHRKFLNWEWANDPNMVAFFMYILLKANFNDGVYEKTNIKRGQLVFGRKTASEETGLSERSIRTCLERLKKSKEVTIKTTNRFSVITICKYNSYQLKSGDNDQQTDHIQEYYTSIVDIVGFLNNACGKGYKSDTPKTQKLIIARLKEGFTVDDFKKVIRIKNDEWKNTDMRKFIRPETLFGNKFESYLNQKEKERGLVH